MTCQDAESLLPLFFDGELDSRRMREVAVHATRCPSCEGSLRELESIQNHLQSMLAEEVDAVDLSGLWPAIEGRLPPPRAALWQRLRLWWEEHEEPRWGLALPATAAVATIAALALFASFRIEPIVSPDASRVASTDYLPGIDRLETSFESVAVFSDPDTRTTVLWIGDEMLDAGTEADDALGSELFEGADFE